MMHRVAPARAVPVAALLLIAAIAARADEPAPARALDAATLDRLGIPAHPAAFEQARLGARRAGVYFEPLRLATSAVSADVDGDGEAEIVVLAQASWLAVSPDGLGGRARSLIVYGRARWRWEPVFHAPIKTVHDRVALTVARLDADERPELVVVYECDEGGAALAEVYENEPEGWRVAVGAPAVSVAFADADGDGLAELVCGRRLESVALGPDGHGRVVFPELVVYREGRLTPAGAERAGFYRAELDRVQAALDGASPAAFGPAADAWRLAYAEKAWRLRRVLAGQPPFGERD